MAVYKATYCYPFLGSCDIRVAPGETQWITCKVDSSNKKITGYRISIYDENNNLIFPYYSASDAQTQFQKRDWNISPVSELLYGDRLSRDSGGNLVMIEEDGETEIRLPSQEYLTNSGLNGSYLNLPFFQNDTKKVRESANAAYYVPRWSANYIVRPILEEKDDYYTPENSDYWVRHSDGKYYYNSSGDSLKTIDEAAGSFTAKLNGDSKIRPGQTVLLYLSKGSNRGALKENAVVIGHFGYGSAWTIVPEYSTRSEDIQGGAKEIKSADLPCICLITKGNYHNSVYGVDKSGLNNYVGPLWKDYAGHRLNFIVGKSYKWEITLYQGNGSIVKKENEKARLIDYTNIDVDEWYDMVLQSGKVLGSCPTRIQLAKYDEGNDSYLLPKNKDGSSVVLYQTYAQLVNDSGKDLGSRFYVNTYSSTLGHVYPLESEAGTISVAGAEGIEFYEHSNNPEAILDTDIVEFAAVENHVYNKGDVAGNMELCGVQNVDDVIGEDGKYVLLMYQKDSAQNGVYKMVSDSDNTITLKTKVTSTTVDEKTKEEKTTTSEVSKIFKRDSTNDVYDGNGLPLYFAWTHEMTETEMKNGETFEHLTYYSKKRYLRKDNSTADEKDEKASIVYPKADGKNENGVTLSNVKMAVWTRAGGYTSWSDFVGKIIYVKSGTVNGQKNFTSTATAGGTLMKKAYDDTTSGSSPLYFVSERPVVLFPQLLMDDYSIKAMGIPGLNSPSKNDVDGVLLSDGDYFMNESTGIIYKYDSIDPKGPYIKEKDPTEDKKVEYYYINQGKKNGQSICKIDGTVSDGQVKVPSEDLYRADVLKNTVTRTYIGQYLNLDTDMILKFDDKVINLVGKENPISYFRIKGVNKTVWYVDHDELTSPLRSYSNNQNEPYPYKICTFYKKSDENPFYSRETPYLIINDGLDDEYSKDDDMSLLAVYPTKEDGTLADSAVLYDLAIDGIFTGTEEQALSNLSYIQEIPESSADVKTTSENFYFPVLKESSGEDNKLGLKWQSGDQSGTTPFVFTFSEKKVQNAATIEALIQKFDGVFGRNSTKKALGAGRVGLRSLGLPEDMITAAATKYKESSSKETFLVYNYSPSSETGYKLSLNGLYKQGNGGSWESYRWVLEKVKFNGLEDSQISSMVKQGDISLCDYVSDSITIKDTGTKYDKRMNVEFYGLLDNLENSTAVGVGGKTLFSNVYLITLYVTDENGIDLEEKRFVEYKAPVFTASTDYCIESFGVSPSCCNECVKLTIKPGFIDNQGKPTQNGDTNYLKEFSIFRREYKKLYRFNNGNVERKILIGNKWEPVVLNVASKVKAEGDETQALPLTFLDFNIKSGYSYQYVIFPASYSEQAKKIPYIYANTGKNGSAASEYNDSDLWRPYSSALSKPVKLNMQYWSIVNLIPANDGPQPDSNIDTYVADPDNIWLFKYQVESGSLTQNISKNEYSTLGRYSKIGIGRKDFLSGSVSCYLGSEIVPLSGNGYVERTPASREQPMSTNEKAYMVGRWREFIASGTPKLLRDTKGQSWIVQVMDGSTTTNENIAIKPDTINFSWRQIADTEDTVIYADATQVPSEEGYLGEWQEDIYYE